MEFIIPSSIALNFVELVFFFFFHLCGAGFSRTILFIYFATITYDEKPVTTMLWLPTQNMEANLLLFLIVSSVFFWLCADFSTTYQDSSSRTEISHKRSISYCCKGTCCLW